jgi:hypothetical protein
MSDIEHIFGAEDAEDWQIILMELDDEDRLREIQQRCDAVADFIDAELDFREEHQ